MAENEQASQPLPEQFATIEAAAEFWDSHDVADYEELMRKCRLTAAIAGSGYFIPSV